MNTDEPKEQDAVSSAEPLSEDEVAELRRKRFKQEMSVVDVSDVEGQLQEQQGRQRTRKMSAEALERVKDAHLPQVALSRSSDEVSQDDNPHAKEIQEIANRTPEVRFTKAQMLRPFSDSELKIIAAALRSGVALYRVADSLHCSIHKIENAIRDVPILAELAQERVSRRKQQAMEAVDDCVKARVPAVVMWNAEKILPEIYGNQVNLDNEDDTRLVIGAIPEDEVEAAEAAVAAAAESVPDVQVNAVMETLQEERGAELAAAGGGVPVSPLNQVPAAPALHPPAGDSRFTGFVPASEMNRVPMVTMPPSDAGPNNYGAVGGGGFDDFDDGSWI